MNRIVRQTSITALFALAAVSAFAAPTDIPAGEWIPEVKVEAPSQLSRSAVLAEVARSGSPAAGEAAVAVEVVTASARTRESVKAEAGRAFVAGELLATSHVDHAVSVVR